MTKDPALTKKGSILSWSTAKKIIIKRHDGLDNKFIVPIANNVEGGRVSEGKVFAFVIYKHLELS